jgi:hypothetical protein
MSEMMITAKTARTTALLSRKKSGAAAALLLLAGCTGMEGISGRNLIIPPDAVPVSRSLTIPLESVAAAAVLFVVIDPLAPNWQIEELRLNESYYRIAMRKKRFTTGGDGEAMPAFYRRAEQLVKDHGGARYRIVEFTEGVDSGVPIAQRVAQGVVEILR